MAVGLADDVPEALGEFPTVGDKRGARVLSVGDVAGSALISPIGWRSTRRANRTRLSRTNPPMAIFGQMPLDEPRMRGSLAVGTRASGRPLTCHHSKTHGTPDEITPYPTPAAGSDYRDSCLGTGTNRKEPLTPELGSPFVILCVCTGNVCRSPVAERLLAHWLGPEVQVRSAGTLGLAGRGIEPEMVAHLKAAGVPEVEFVARRMTPADVRGADLVLGLGREHRREAVELVPAAVRRAFTLLEFARLLSTIDA